jgi:hypothetical protein
VEEDVGYMGLSCLTVLTYLSHRSSWQSGSKRLRLPALQHLNLRDRQFWDLELLRGCSRLQVRQETAPWAVAWWWPGCVQVECEAVC